jgi:hypothetical protein
MDGGGNGRLRFGDFEFDSLCGRLFREGRPVKIEHQPITDSDPYELAE